MKNSTKTYFCEAIGTALLMFFGCSTILLGYKSVGIVGIAIVFALVYILCYYTICKKSGCHLNPVVSLAMLMCKKIDKKSFGFYVLAQFIGSVCACLVMMTIAVSCFSSQSLLSNFNICNGFGIYSQLKISVWGAIIIELICTFTFVLFYLCSHKIKKLKKYNGVCIGLLYALLILFSFQCTGTCLNPFRALAPALCALGLGSIEPLIQFPVFLLTTTAAACLAAFLYRFLDNRNYLR